MIMMLIVAVIRAASRQAAAVAPAAGHLLGARPGWDR